MYDHDTFLGGYVLKFSYLFMTKRKKLVQEMKQFTKIFAVTSHWIFELKTKVSIINWSVTERRGVGLGRGLYSHSNVVQVKFNIEFSSFCIESSLTRVKRLLMNLVITQEPTSSAVSSSSISSLNYLIQYIPSTRFSPLSHTKPLFFMPMAVADQRADTPGGVETGLN